MHRFLAIVFGWIKHCLTGSLFTGRFCNWMRKRLPSKCCKRPESAALGTAGGGGRQKGWSHLDGAGDPMLSDWFSESLYLAQNSLPRSLCPHFLTRSQTLLVTSTPTLSVNRLVSPTFLSLSLSSLSPHISLSLSLSPISFSPHVTDVPTSLVIQLRKPAPYQAARWTIEVCDSFTWSTSMERCLLGPGKKHSFSHRLRFFRGNEIRLRLRCCWQWNLKVPFRCGSFAMNPLPSWAFVPCFSKDF